MMYERSKLSHKTAFTLAEVLLALGLITIAILALLAQDTYLLSSNQKLDDTTIACDVATSALARTTQQIERDQPANRLATAWASNDTLTPFAIGTERVGTTDYSYEVFITDVVNQTNGKILGSGSTGTENPDTRLKLLTVSVTWWDQKKGGSSAARGSLKTEQSKLLKVTNVSTP